ncbi:uncharacterized protein LOC111830225 [Capsella rubella]|uniref:uncharacterized protein LOC111830225 n=1 Tax=Capsella rubella TaxID=81985 RepID=UPI000CD5AEF9|nr:uncharacterized protein LOC111830225 [Capsella rubella]
MNMRKCITLVLLVEAVVTTTMGGEVEALSCWDKCMFVCGFKLNTKEFCTQKCLKQCHLPPLLPSQLSHYRTNRFDQTFLTTNTSAQRSVVFCVYAE